MWVNVAFAVIVAFVAGGVVWYGCGLIENLAALVGRKRAESATTAPPPAPAPAAESAPAKPEK